MSFHLDIITPAGKMFDEQVSSIQACGLLGGFEVFSGHEPMIIALKEGGFKIRKDGKEILFSCGSGVLEVTPDHQVLVLVETAKQ